jgi:hypothetical protein
MATNSILIKVLALLLLVAVSHAIEVKNLNLERIAVGDGDP